MGSKNGFQVFSGSLHWEVGMDSEFSLVQSLIGSRSGFCVFTGSLQWKVGMGFGFSLAISFGK